MSADPFKDLAVDRVDRPDGRYVLYYHWLRETDVAGRPTPSSPDAREAADPDPIDV